ncbi:hypothetical protein Glove_114g77 [Diversispora epigaea]|uniref:Uncharacterized protein n=1 Tax=Diversispora epigaea TaxID=1348612 RepID=A0A397JAS6_9GLOM|nr:hypothetical protein Glove_114g77 [Diversispora epigaea]
MYQQQQKQQQITSTAATTYSTRTHQQLQHPRQGHYQQLKHDDVKNEIIGSNDADNPLKLLSSVSVSVQEEQNCRPKRDLNEDLGISIFWSKNDENFEKELEELTKSTSALSIVASELYVPDF